MCTRERESCFVGIVFIFSFLLLSFACGPAVAIVLPGPPAYYSIVLILIVVRSVMQLHISEMLASLLEPLSIYFPKTFFACVIEMQTGNVRELNPLSPCQSLSELLLLLTLAAAVVSVVADMHFPPVQRPLPPVTLLSIYLSCSGCWISSHIGG